MLRPTWGMVAILVLGFLIGTQGFAGAGHVESIGKAPSDHHSLAIYYEEQAQINKTKAADWEFAATYYEKFPGEVSGKMTAAEHVAHCRSIAEDFKKLEQQNRELAAKHRELMRKDFH